MPPHERSPKTIAPWEEEPFQQQIHMQHFQEHLHHQLQTIHQNLSRYRTEIQGFMQRHDQELKDLLMHEDHKIFLMQRHRNEQYHTIMKQQQGERNTLLQSNIQLENQHPDQLLQGLRKQLVSIRKGRTLAECYEQNGRDTWKQCQQSSLVELWKHVMEELELFWKHVVEELVLEINLNHRDYVACQHRAHKDAEIRWSHQKDEHREMWRCMLHAQEELAQEEEEDTYNFIQLERQVVFQHLAREQRHLWQKIGRELKELRQVFSKQHDLQKRANEQLVQGHQQSIEQEITLLLQNFQSASFGKHRQHQQVQAYTPVIGKCHRELWQETFRRATELFQRIYKDVTATVRFSAIESEELAKRMRQEEKKLFHRLWDVRFPM